MNFVYTLFLIAAVFCMKADGVEFPVTPAHTEPAANSSTSKRLGFCILDYGSPHIYGSPTSFWISGSGHVFTQAFKTHKDGWEEERYEYTLSDAERATLLRLLDVLREDDRILRERYGVPGGFSPHIAFTISPLSDLFLRERHSIDTWIQFSAVSSHLSELHQRKIGDLKPVFVGKSKDEKLWEPVGFISRTTIYPLRYIGSDRYNTILEENDKSEQDGARQPATAVGSKSEGKEKPKPESEGRSQ